MTLPPNEPDYVDDEGNIIADDALPFDVPEPEVIPIGAQPPEYPWHQRVKPYAKFLIALVGFIATAGLSTFADSPEAVRWFGFIGGIATSVGVYLTPNKTPDGI